MEQKITTYEELSTLLSEAKCPKNVFGENATLRSVVEQFEAFKEILKNEPETVGKTLVERRLYLFKEWAEETLRKGEYEEVTPYRLEFKVEVIEDEGVLYFRIQVEKGAIRFPKLPANLFEGLLHSDKVVFTPNTGPVTTGSINWRGGHGGDEYVFRSIFPRDPNVLSSSDFQIGDTIVVYTWKDSDPTKILEPIFTNRYV